MVASTTTLRTHTAAHPESQRRQAVSWLLRVAPVDVRHCPPCPLAVFDIRCGRCSGGFDQPLPAPAAECDRYSYKVAAKSTTRLSVFLSSRPLPIHPQTAPSPQPSRPPPSPTCVSRSPPPPPTPPARPTLAPAPPPPTPTPPPVVRPGV
eukprot:4735810-Prymnesium_polylepis.1